MCKWFQRFLYRIIPGGVGLGFLSHKSVIPEQRWSGMPEIWREMISSYRAFIPITRLIASEKKGAFRGKLGERGP